MHMVAEGAKTAKSVYNYSRKLKVDMPICHEIYRILYEDLAPKKAVYRLMTRTLKQELDQDQGRWRVAEFKIATDPHEQSQTS